MYDDRRRARSILARLYKLLEEALDQARETRYESTRTRVLSIEHLVAICLQTGRDKDRERIHLFRREGKIDLSLLDSILQRYGLLERWRQWSK